MQTKKWKSKQYTPQLKIINGDLGQTEQNNPKTFRLNDMNNKTKILNHMHENHLHNTDDDGQALGEVKYVQMNMRGMHI